MKKLLYLVPALLLFAMIAAPNARADSYTPNFSCQPGCPDGPPTAPNVTFSPGEPTAISVTAEGGLDPANPVPVPVNLSLPAADAPDDTYSWVFGVIFGDYNTGDSFFNIYDETNGSQVGITFSQGYDTAVQGPLTFTPASAATPEPAPVILMLCGVGLVFFMRKRFIVRTSVTA